MKETDLAKHFIEYLSDFDLYFEVGVLGSFADIVAVKEPIKMAIEVKTSFSLAVIEQAVQNCMFYHYSYVAVPKLKYRGRLQFDVCEHYGIGVLEYDDNYGKREHGEVSQVVAPKINRKAVTKLVHLSNFQKSAIAGCMHGRPSPFKEMVHDITEYLKTHNGATFKEVFGSSYVTYRHISAFKGGMYRWTRENVIKEFHIDKGRLYLNQISEPIIHEYQNND